VQRACLALALLVTAACGSSSTPTAPGAATRQRIVVLGDSLAISPTGSQNFVSELQTRLSSTHPGWTIANAGVFGDTTGGGVARVDRALTNDTAILVLELGANDGIQGVSISLIEGNLGTIIQRAQARSVRVLLCGMETFPFNGVDYALDFHNLFPRVADRYRVPLVPFLLEGVALNPDLNGPDGVHPNAAGARAIAATVWPYLEAVVVAQTASY
jgi:acyl-CoA thioesterase-1